jgi:copper chaperone NosL
MHRILFSFIVLLIGCNVQPEPIQYGKEACHFCQMNIVDARFGAQLVTTKGKIFKFDAIECMINYKMESTLAEDDYAHIVINSFDKKGELIPAQTSVFLRSSELPSPMGMYITPFENKKMAMEQQSIHGGEIFDWDELNRNFSSLPKISN